MGDYRGGGMKQILYICDFCGERFVFHSEESHNKSAHDHHLTKCQHNPATKGCTTCKHGDALKKWDDTLGSRMCPVIGEFDNHRKEYRLYCSGWVLRTSDTEVAE